MRDVKAQIELGKQEVMSEVRENMNFIKEIQGEFSVLRSKLDNINQMQSDERGFLQQAVVDHMMKVQNEIREQIVEIAKLQVAQVEATIVDHQLHESLFSGVSTGEISLKSILSPAGMRHNNNSSNLDMMQVMGNHPQNGPAESLKSRKQSKQRNLAQRKNKSQAFQAGQLKRMGQSSGAIETGDGQRHDQNKTQ